MQCEGIFKWEHVALTCYRRDNWELCLNSFLAVGEAKVENAKKPGETLLPGISAAADQCCCENPVPCIKAGDVEGGSELCS